MCICATLLATGARSITHLKVLNGVRYLIEMMLLVILDMRYFFLLLMACIIIFGALYTHVE